VDLLVQAAAFLIDTVGTLLLAALLLRFWLQAARASWGHPLAPLVQGLTHWGVRPLRRLVPGWRGLDLATLVLAGLLAWAMTLVLAWLDPVYALPGPRIVGQQAPGAMACAVLALAQLLRLFIYLLVFVLIAEAVLSWVQPASPWAPALAVLTRPLLAPIRARIRPVGALDLSPLILLIVSQLVLILIVGGLQRLAMSSG
jgi:YggT family protein